MEMPENAMGERRNEVAREGGDGGSSGERKVR